MSPVARAPRRYFIEFNGAMLLYVAAVLGRGELAGHVADPVLKALLLISSHPAGAAGRTGRAAVLSRHGRIPSPANAGGSRHCGGCGRRRCHLVDVPRRPRPAASVGAYTWPLIAVAWAVVALYLGWKDKVSEGAGWKALRYAASTLNLRRHRNRHLRAGREPDRHFHALAILVLVATVAVHRAHGLFHLR